MGWPRRSAGGAAWAKPGYPLGNTPGGWSAPTTTGPLKTDMCGRKRAMYMESVGKPVSIAKGHAQENLFAGPGFPEVFAYSSASLSKRGRACCHCPTLTARKGSW